jgi:hypothetical protein
LEGWLKKDECFYRLELNNFSGYRRTLGASGGSFLFVFSHNRAEKDRFS